jgi:DNA-binding NarL/FixJ family response regulator
MIGERTSWETLRSQLSTHQVVTVRLPTTEDADFAQAALDVGGLGYVVKARLASDLLPAIRAALADCRFISPTLRLFAAFRVMHSRVFSRIAQLPVAQAARSGGPDHTSSG